MAVIKERVLRVLVKSLLEHSKLPLDVIYDIDDVLNNLNEEVFRQIGGTWRPYRFNIRECKDVSPELQDRVLNMYKNPELFKQLQWVPGAHEITEVEKDGSARVWINSNNFSNDVRAVKEHRVLTELTEVNPDRVILQVEKAEDKKSVPGDIIVEDHILNCLKYKDWAVKILINKTWNQPEQYEIAEDFYHIVRVSSLIEANQAVKEIIAALKAEIQRS